MTRRTIPEWMIVGTCGQREFSLMEVLSQSHHYGVLYKLCRNLDSHKINFADLWQLLFWKFHFGNFLKQFYSSGLLTTDICKFGKKSLSPQLPPISCPWAQSPAWLLGSTQLALPLPLAMRCSGKNSGRKIRRWGTSPASVTNESN